MKTSQARFGLISAALAMIAAMIAAPASAATDPGLLTAASFGVLGGTTVTNTGPTVINGNLGVSPGSAIVGFDSPDGPGMVNPPGTIHANDGVAQQAQADLTTAYNNAAGSPCDQILTGTDLGGLTLVPGTYCFDTSAQLTGALTLNTQGNPDSVFIFKMGSTLTTASNSSVTFINGPSCGVYWQVGSSATLGTTTKFIGSILAHTSITANNGTTVEGRLLARGGAVTLDDIRVTKPHCPPAETPAPTPTPDPTPTPTPDPTPTPTPDDTPAPQPTDSGPAPTVVGPGTSLPPGSQVDPGSIVFESPPGSAGSTTGTPTSSDGSSLEGQPVTLRTQVTSVDGTVPTGTVTFIDGSTVLGSVPLDDRGAATFSTSALKSGEHAITAVYQGSARVSGSVSKLFLQTVSSGSGTQVNGKELPRTGANVLPMGLGGTLSILIGMAFILEARRRERKITHLAQLPR